MYDNDPASGTFGSYIGASHAEVFRDHLAATDDRKVNKMEECLRGTKTWLEDLYTYYKHCNRAGTDECHNKREVCDAKQHDFEVARCWWAVDHDYHCTSYEHCVRNRLTACVGVCEDLDDYLASTKRDYSTGETIQCLLEALFGRYNTAYDPDAKAYIDAVSGNPTDDPLTGETANARNDAAWPLIPRGETDDEKKSWLDWCSGSQTDVETTASKSGGFDDAKGLSGGNAVSKNPAEVLERYYHNNEQEYPFWNGAALEDPVTFTEIKHYEAEYFTVRCRGGSRIRNARRHLSGVNTITHQECSGPAPAGYEFTGTGKGARSMTRLVGAVEVTWDPWQCFEAFSSHEDVSNYFGLDRSEFAEDATWSWDNPSEAKDGTKYDLWPQRTTNQPFPDPLSSAAGTRPMETSGMGTVLYLTYLEKYHYPGNGVRLFDCSQEPVPGEWSQFSGAGATAAGCHTPPPDDSDRYTWMASEDHAKTVQASQHLSAWPHFGCFADVYRVDSLRTDVPACDIDVKDEHGEDAKTFWLSHASNMKYGVVDTTVSGATSKEKNPDGLGCSAAEHIREQVTGAGYTGNGYVDEYTEGEVIDVDHTDRSKMHGRSGFACAELTHDPKTGSWAHADDLDRLYGTCCDEPATFWEPIPKQVDSACTSDCAFARQSSYECKNHYMFTYAERELALGLSGENQGFHTDDYRTTKGFFKAQRHNLIADNKADTTASLTAAMRGGVGVDDLDGNFDSTDSVLKTPWSLSSDIQGAYTVVSTTASLGTACTFRYSMNKDDHKKYVNAEGQWNAADDVTLDAKVVRSAATPGVNGGYSGEYRYQNHAEYSGENL